MFLPEAGHKLLQAFMGVFNSCNVSARSGAQTFAGAYGAPRDGIMLGDGFYVERVKKDI